MGGGSNATAATAAPAPPPQPVLPITNYSAFSPGQQGLLAQQMQAGFGGSLLDQTNSMDHYQNMMVPRINAPGDIANYMNQVDLPVTEGGTPANTAAYYQATTPPPIGSRSQAPAQALPQAAAAAAAAAAPAVAATQRGGTSGVYLAGDSGAQYPIDPSEYHYGVNFFGR
jgi:hypothetical protein